MTKTVTTAVAAAPKAPKAPVVNTAAVHAKAITPVLEAARAPTVSANPTKVEFPRDQFQSTQEVRGAGLRAAGRVGMSKEKLDVLLATYKVLAAHAVARFEQAGEMHAETLAAAKARAAKDAELERKRKVAAVEQLKAQLDAAEKAL